MSMSPHFLRDRPDRATDQLSEVLRLVEAHSVVSGGFAVGGAWTTRFVMSTPLKFLAMVRGTARLCVEGVGTFEVAGGDVVVLNNRHWGALTGGPPSALPVTFTLTEQDRFLEVDDAGDDVVIGGHVDVNHVGEELLVGALPPVIHVRDDEARPLRRVLEDIYDEVSTPRVGAAFALAQHAQLLVLTALRAYLGQAADLPVGWLRLLADELARAAAMSRTSFAERFRAVAGVPPLTYLNGWRMRLAQRALRDGDIRMGPLAAELGYLSESAFSTAFRRETGMSPLQYRTRARGAQK
jgi:AraC-like DNA-binding protein